MNTKHMLEFAAILTKEFPDKSIAQIADEGYALHLLAKQLQRLNVQYCNGDVDSEVYTAKKDKIKAKVKQLGYGGYFNGDPRGAAIKLHLPSGLTNDWGREGWCVPE